MTQKEALDILKTGANVFLTGAAGSGKTFVLNEYIKYLKENNVDVGITASTGIAATHMGGVTIHSWIGMGIKDRLTNTDVDEIVEKHYLKNRLKNVSVLIIDEISMLHHFRLDMVDKILRRAKQNSKEIFGGIQVVLSGDFFQLPPVSRRDEQKSMFAYHSEAWKDGGFRISYLHEQFRQDDSDYLRILNSIRDDNVDEYVLEILESRFGKSVDSKLEPTKLYSHNIDVDAENQKELGKISGRFVEYEMKSRGNRNLVELLKKSCLAPERLLLKEGAKVMFVKNNFEAGFVNGTLGVVVRCTPDSIKVRTLKGQFIDVEQESWTIEEDGKIKAEIVQYPLRLAWAITVHKSQGMSLDAAEIDLSNSFESGMGYVALSRVRSLDGLYLKGLNDTALRVHEEVLLFDRDFRNLSEENSINLNKHKRGTLDTIHKDFISKVGVSKSNKKVKVDTVSTTKAMLLEEMSIKEIATIRNLKEETVISHIEEILEKDPRFNIKFLQKSISHARLDKIISAFRKVGVQEGGKRPLSPVKNILGPNYSFGEIRLARLFL